MQPNPHEKCLDVDPGNLVPESARILHAAAFGALADGMGAPLPSARSGCELWWRAVAHGGMGYYARAEADLNLLRRSNGRDPRGLLLRSLESSTRASLLRQMGNHEVAAEFDGRALALTTPGNAVLLPARADALTGLAADALGRSDHRVAARLLEMCADELGEGRLGDGGDLFWRPRLRLLWVRAETAMAAGDGDSALAAANAASKFAEAVRSERHRVKTLLIAAAAAAVAGQSALSAERAEQVLERARSAGLLPLRWAACMLLNGVRPSPAVAAELVRCEMAMRCRGGYPS